MPSKHFQNCWVKIRIWVQKAGAKCHWRKGRVEGKEQLQIWGWTLKAELCPLLPAPPAQPRVPQLLQSTRDGSRSLHARWHWGTGAQLDPDCPQPWWGGEDPAQSTGELRAWDAGLLFLCALIEQIKALSVGMFPSSGCGHHSTGIVEIPARLLFAVLLGSLKPCRQHLLRPSVPHQLDSVACLIALCYYWYFHLV